MAKSSKLIKRVVVVIFLSVLVMNFYGGGQAQISCVTVIDDLYPCHDFVVKGGKVDPACCNGLKTVIKLAKTKLDRQSVCSCVKFLLARFTDDQVKNSSSIPGLCGVNPLFNVTRGVDCSKVDLDY